MKKHWLSAALALLLILLIPVAASADVIYPAPEAMTVGQRVEYLLATLDPGGTVWTNADLMPEGLYLETEEVESGVNVYLRGVPTVPGSYDLIINYNGSNSICTLRILPKDEPVTLRALSVETLPEELRYTAGDVLDPAGLSLRLEMSDGSTETVAEGYSLYPTRLERAGTQRIEVSYSGMLCYFEVEVAPAPEVIEGIGVLTLPNKVVYEPGETLEPDGLSIRVYTNNGSRDVGAEELTCSPLELTDAGSHQITVSYEGKTCEFSVQVLEEESPAGMTVFHLPEKLEYTVGDNLDTTGLVLLVAGSRSSVEYLVSGYTCEPFALNSPGPQEITVRYGELECRFHVTVKAAAPGPFHPPVVTTDPYPAPASDTAGEEPLPASEPARVPSVLRPRIQEASQTQSGTVLAGVIVVAAVLALLVLAVYVFLMNRSGQEYFAESLRDLFRRKR